MCAVHDVRQAQQTAMTGSQTGQIAFTTTGGSECDVFGTHRSLGDEQTFQAPDHEGRLVLGLFGQGQVWKPGDQAVERHG